MRKYAVIHGLRVANFIDHPEENFEMEGFHLVDVTDLPDLPSLGDLFLAEQFRTPPHLLESNLVIETVEETKAIEDKPTDKK